MQNPLAPYVNSWIGPGLILAGLIAVAVSALVALPEHGAALRSWIGAPLPGRHERVGALRWWVTPYEPNAFARRFTTTATLNDLAVIDDGRTILVLGDDGTLLVSVNAGATWKSLADNVQWRDGAPLDEPRRGSQPPLVDLESVASSPDGRLAIAVGSNGTVLTTDDDGLAWTERESGSSAWLRSVAFDASTGRAIAVGAGGTVLTSNDRGFTWAERDSGTSASLESVVFDASTGRAIAVGAGGTVLTSSDGGVTWAERDTGIGASLESVAFDASTGRAIAVGAGGTVLTSNDRGFTWVEPDSGTSASLESVAFDASTDRAIAVGAGGTVLTSSDGGVTWAERDSGTSASLESVAFDASTGRATLVGTIGTVLTSDDYGVMWTERTSGAVASLTSVAFDAGTGRAVAVGPSGTVFTSDDSGVTWTERDSGSSAWLESVAFDAGTRRAIAVGSNGTVLTSDDDGVTWTERDSGSSVGFTVVAFDPKMARVIVGGRDETVLTSDDNGVTWTERNSGFLVAVSSIAFDATTGRAILVWADGTVFTSDDSGDTWIERESGTSASLLSVAYDANTGRAIAVGMGGAVLTSDDSGVTWTERDSGSAAWIYSVAYDATTGRAIGVGAGGAVLTSDDDGVTWTERDSGSAAWIYSVAFDGSTGRAIAVGIGGTPIISDDAGVTWTPVLFAGSVYPAPLSAVGLLLLLGGLVLLVVQPAHGIHGILASRRESADVLDSSQPPAPEDEDPSGSRRSTYFKRILDLFVSDRPVVPEDEDSSELGRSAYREGILDLLVSDRPLGSGGQDRLGYDLYVRGLSGLLRNPGTGFPITIAVTGEWGIGKSSFMRLLEDDLKGERYFAAWFNAWHDQNEESVLSSLLQAIRNQAVPRIVSRDVRRAVALRINLLRSRVLIYVVPVVVLAFLLATIGTYAPFHVTEEALDAACDRLNAHGPPSSERLDDCKGAFARLEPGRTGTAVWTKPSELRDAIERLEPPLPHPGYTLEVERALRDKVAHVGTPSLRNTFGVLWPNRGELVWLWLIAVGVAALTIAHGASAFGLNLRRGVAGIGGTVGFLLRVAAHSVDPAGRHEQLRRDFSRVSDSIGRHLVIFIDDLDRCQPGRVVETLEAVNFLVTAGECAVVMGMDYELVQHCVGLARKDLAEAESDPAAGEGTERERRAAYAHRYLQKLINLQMQIVAEPERVRGLVTQDEPAEEAPAEEEPAEGELADEERVMSNRLWKWLSRPWVLRVWALLLAIAVSVPFVIPYVQDAFVPVGQVDVLDPIPGVGERPAPQREQPSPEPRDEELHSDTEGEVPLPTLGDIERTVQTKPAHGIPSVVVVWPVIVGVSLILPLGLLLTFLVLYERGVPKLLDRVRTLSRRVWGMPDEVQDSEAFRKALEIWSDALVLDEPTPRTIKRFRNSLRYFAAMLRAEHGAEMDWRREANLVALAAMHHLGVDVPEPATPEQPHECFQDGSDAAVTQGSGTEDDVVARERTEQILKVWHKHFDRRSWVTDSGVRVGHPWPPDETEIKQFRKFAAGIQA